MRIILLGLFCLALAALTLWWTSTEEQPPSTLSQLNNQGLDYFIRDIKTITLGPNGQPTQTLQAAAIRHFRADGGTKLQQPMLLMHPETGPPWHLTAANGHLSVTGDELILAGPVQITRAESPTTAPVQLDTQNVRIQTQQHYLETPEPVQVVSAAHHIQAIGMQAWLQAPVKLHFLHAVRGHYVPRQ